MRPYLGENFILIFISDLYLGIRPRYARAKKNHANGSSHPADQSRTDANKTGKLRKHPATRPCRTIPAGRNYRSVPAAARICTLGRGKTPEKNMGAEINFRTHIRRSFADFGFRKSVHNFLRARRQSALPLSLHPRAAFAYSACKTADWSLPHNRNCPLTASAQSHSAPPTP